MRNRHQFQDTRAIYRISKLKQSLNHVNGDLSTFLYAKPCISYSLCPKIRTNFLSGQPYVLNLQIMCHSNPVLRSLACQFIDYLTKTSRINECTWRLCLKFWVHFSFLKFSHLSEKPDTHPNQYQNVISYT